MPFSIIYNFLIYINSAGAYTMNFLFIYLIMKYTGKGMGKYHYILFAYSVFNSTFPTVHLIAAPTVFVHEYSVCVFSHGWLFNYPTASHWMMILYISYYSQSHLMLWFHYVYRWVVICKPGWIDMLHSKMCGMACVLLYIFITGITIIVVQLTMTLPEDFYPYIDGPFREQYNISVFGVGMAGANYRRLLPDGSRKYDLRALAVLPFVGWVTSSLIYTIAYCSYKIYRTLNSSDTSFKRKQMQMDLFRALIVQTSIPVLLEYIPAFMAFTFPLFAIPIDVGFLTVLKSLYPACEPVFLIYFVKDYRRGLLHLFRKRRPHEVKTIIMETTSVNCRANSNVISTLKI